MRFTCISSWGETLAVLCSLNTKQMIARFEAERQALALIDDPSTARVLDSGTTDAGRPYFVMDLARISDSMNRPVIRLGNQ